MPRRIFAAGSVTNTTGAPLRLEFYPTSTSIRREADLWTVDGSNNLVERIANGIVLTDAVGAYSAFAGPDDLDTLYALPNNTTSRTTLTATASVTGAPSASSLGGVTVSGTASNGKVLTASSSSAAAWQSPMSTTAGGDLSGTLPSPTVAKVNGVAVTGTPSAGQVITATGSSAATWQSAGGYLAVTQYAGAAAVSTTSATFADIDATNLKVTFTAPTSGNVLARLEALASTAAATTYGWNLRDSNGDVANTKRDIVYNSNASYRISVGIYVTGLTPGTSYTWKWGHGLLFGNTSCGLAGNGTTAESALMTVVAV